MPNLGGHWIEDEDIRQLEKLTGQIRKDKYNEIVNFIIDNFGLTSFMLNVQFGKKPDENQVPPRAQ